MTKEQAINYLKSSGFSDEQIKAVIDAFTCDDCISREEAKSAIREAYKDLPTRCEINEILNSLPSVKPNALERDNSALERVEDCISREMALKEAYRIVIDGDVFEVVQVETLLGLPSVKPQRAKGHWIKSKEPNDAEPIITYICSNCGNVVYGNGKSSYCPYCGSHNGGDSNDD